ncbi:uncharacterized protein LOC101887553 [Musca domestica]|uniref:Uncharacterized protein LOC101887553 isoform X2 n=1 Tax=Musca domestica TaxID=7370 RepID=A0A1I8MAF3_MUSDO|nr:uncharacterized protein LOC101887553 [Musca domestica]
MTLKWKRETTEQLINCVKQNPSLYNVSTPGYLDRKGKDRTWDKILAKMVRFDPHLNKEEIRRKWRNLRVQFMQEERMLNNTKEDGTCGNDDVYIPKLWCYNQMSFLKPQFITRRRIEIVKPQGDNEDNTMDNLEDTENGDSTMEECTNISTQNKKYPRQIMERVWTRELIVALINELKKHELLYNANHPLHADVDMRNHALFVIWSELKKFNTNLTIKHVRVKIRVLRVQYRKELHDLEIDRQRGKRTETPKLWCFRLLSFMRPYTVIQTNLTPKVSSCLSEISEYSNSSEDESPYNGLVEKANSEENLLQEMDKEKTSNLDEDIEGLYTEPEVDLINNEREKSYVDEDVDNIKTYYNEPEDLHHEENNEHYEEEIHPNNPYIALPEDRHPESNKRPRSFNQNKQHRIAQNIKPNNRMTIHVNKNIGRSSRTELLPANSRRRQIETNEELLNVRVQQNNTFDWLGKQVSYEINSLKDEQIQRETIWKIQKLLYEAYRQDRAKNCPDPLGANQREGGSSNL